MDFNVKKETKQKALKMNPSLKSMHGSSAGNKDFSTSNNGSSQKSKSKAFDPFENKKHKVIVIGDQGVGKSMLIQRFVKGTFDT
tara:strand:- start:409 stop:660 length:252 start_codon:yes stop_codon:yes gene_type:complete